MKFERLDLFSSPFYFSVNGSRKGRQTNLSAGLSILILSLGFTFFKTQT